MMAMAIESHASFLASRAVSRANSSLSSSLYSALGTDYSRHVGERNREPRLTRSCG